MKNNISYLTYKITSFNEIEKLIDYLEKNKKNIIVERGINLATEIKKINKIKSIILEEYEIKFFKINLEIERPKRKQGEKSLKHGEVLFYSYNRNLYMLPYSEDKLEPKTVLKGMFLENKKLIYHYNDDFKKDKFNLFVGWLFEIALKENVADRKLDEHPNLILHEICAYKTLSDDRSAYFSGRSKSGIISCPETRYMLISDNEINYLKIKVQYKEKNYEFIISSSEDDNFKVYYDETYFDKDIFNEKLTEEIFILLVNNIIYPKLLKKYRESNWNELKQIVLKEKLIKDIEEEIISKKEELKSRKEEIMKPVQKQPKIREYIQSKFGANLFN